MCMLCVCVCAFSFVLSACGSACAQYCMLVVVRVVCSVCVCVCVCVFKVLFTQRRQGRNMTGDHLLTVQNLVRRQFSFWPMVTFFDYVPYTRDSALNASISPCLAECNSVL